jgi:GDP-mannose 6-dehydrogenase
MKIVVSGLGYVGATATAGLLRDGHTVIGIDVSTDKAAMIESGLSPVSEPGPDELLAAERWAGPDPGQRRLRGTGCSAENP